MSAPVVVGLLDSGVDPGLAPAAWPRRSFVTDDGGAVTSRADGAPDALGHGTELARIILADNAGIVLAMARIFTDRFACTPRAAAAGLDWLIEQGARIVNMSFGLTQDRTVLRRACAHAAETGALLVAAAPARGPATYPGSYSGVVKVSGDARCQPGELSVLGGMQADFGACPGRLKSAGGHEVKGGASFATGHFTSLAATFLSANPEADNGRVLQEMARIATFDGPERRMPPGG